MCGVSALRYEWRSAIPGRQALPSNAPHLHEACFKSTFPLRKTTSSASKRKGRESPGYSYRSKYAGPSRLNLGNSPSQILAPNFFLQVWSSSKNKNVNRSRQSLITCWTGTCHDLLFTWNILVSMTGFLLLRLVFSIIVYVMLKARWN